MATMISTFTTVNGLILHEHSGNTETNYTPDPLGSLIECRDSSGTKMYSAEYWPYGEIQTSTGANPSGWAFCGLQGYFVDSESICYVRSRYYAANFGRWVTLDLIWPSELGYGYVKQNPISESDPSGHQGRKEDPWQKWKDFFNIRFPDTGFGGESRGDVGWNCYTHACSLPYAHPWNPGLNSGFFPGFGDSDPRNLSCDLLIWLAKRDGSIIDADKRGNCPKGYYRVRAYISPGIDFHFIMQNPDGTWSDKHGGGRFGYLVDCRSMTDPDGHAARGGPGIPRYVRCPGTYCAKGR